MELRNNQCIIRWTPPPPQGCNMVNDSILMPLKHNHYGGLILNTPNTIAEGKISHQAHKPSHSPR